MSLPEAKTYSGCIRKKTGATSCYCENITNRLLSFFLYPVLQVTTCFLQPAKSMKSNFTLSPFLFPILAFGLLILLGAYLLHFSFSVEDEPITWIDAVFTATSATCVTGLIVVDTGSFFSRFGESVILVLIQLGGIGIMTYTGLVFYLLNRRVSLVDRIALGQSIIHDKTFNLGKFLLRIVVWTLLIEATGAVLIFIQAPYGFPPFSALFHSVSAFCNAGFSLNETSLMQWQGHAGINAVFIFLIILGGIGFSVLVECLGYGINHLKASAKNRPRPKLSWYSKVILRTTVLLIAIGAILLYFSEFIAFHRNVTGTDAALTALFQSVTCRTAGFNTVNVGSMTNVSLLFMMILMFIGGAPGSCAGGIKVTTFRVLAAFGVAQIRGNEQPVIGKFALDSDTRNKAFVLLVFSIIILTSAIVILNITEGGIVPHYEARGLFLEIVFEVVSAFGTVGLSTGLTTRLTFIGKIVVIGLMFVGRLGPILFITAIHSLQEEKLFKWPEENMLIG